jgi:peptidoglycan hydrolase-like protein with peptidoglycan-binding domain
MNRFLTRGLSACGLALLASCAQTPLAPTAQVTPGPGKSFAAFQDDMAACKKAAEQSVAGQANAANTQALGGAVATALGGDTTANATSGAVTASQQAQIAIQQQYDQTYNTCMASAGDNVPGMEAAEPPPPPPESEPTRVVQRDPLVQKVHAQLIRLSYLRAGADGVAGPRTEAAIRQFETDKAMTVDGVSSRNLLAALQAAAPGGTTAPVAAAPDQSGKFALPPPAQ